MMRLKCSRISSLLYPSMKHNGRLYVTRASNFINTVWLIQTWEDDGQPSLDFAELAVLVSSITAAFVCKLKTKLLLRVFKLPPASVRTLTPFVNFAAKVTAVVDSPPPSWNQHNPPQFCNLSFLVTGIVRSTSFFDS